jgi:SAM-dependent methyltransferase
LEKFGDVDPNWFDSCSLASRYNARLLSHWHSGRTLLRALMVRLRGRLFGPPAKLQPAVAYHGLLIFDRPELHGGGLWYAEDFSRALVHFGIGKCERIFDFCSGPGYIGYYLFASGYCKTLALADINPAATEAARYTARYNGIEDRISIYTSDVLEQIPSSEKWDLVVANTPILKVDQTSLVNICDYDVSGTLHHRFFASIKKFMKPGGLVLHLFPRWYCGPETFRQMIEAGGGRIVDCILQKDFRGVESDRFYLLSSW